MPHVTLQIPESQSLLVIVFDGAPDVESDEKILTLWVKEKFIKTE